MKYTLVIGFEFKKYRKPADITIHVNNRFVDCFDLQSSYGTLQDVATLLETKWYNELNKTSWLDTKNNYWEGVKIPKFVKVYHIDEEHLGGLLTIDVKNSNSDATNGFIKHSSLIRIPLMALFPSVMSENDGEGLMKTIVKSDHVIRHKVEEDILQDIIAQKPHVKNMSTGLRHDWPCADSYYVRRKSEIYEKSKVVTNHHEVGGSFTAEVKIQRKHRTFFLASNLQERRGFLSSSLLSKAIASYKPLLNIYNEDQRSDNT